MSEKEQLYKGMERQIWELKHAFWSSSVTKTRTGLQNHLDEEQDVRTGLAVVVNGRASYKV